MIFTIGLVILTMSGLFLGLNNYDYPEEDFHAEFVAKPKTSIVGEYITFRVNLGETLQGFGPSLFL